MYFLKTASLCLLLFLLGSSGLWGQKLTWGEIHKTRNPREPQIGKVLEVNQGEILAFHNYDSGMGEMLGGVFGGMNVTSEVLSIWDSKLQLLKHADASQAYKGKPLQYQAAFVLGGKLILFYSFVNRKQKKAYLFSRTFNKETLKPSGELQMIYEVDAKSRVRYGDFAFQVSANHEYLAIYHTEEFDRKEDQESFRVRMFGTGMELAWEKEVILERVNKRTVINQALVSNEGACFLLGKEFLEGTGGGYIGNGGIDGFTKNNKYEFWLYGIDSQGAEIQDRTISSRQKLSKAVIELNEAGQLVLFTCYSPNKYHSVQGVHLELIDPRSLEAVNIKEFPFPQQYLGKFLSEKELAKKDEIEDFETSFQRLTRYQTQDTRVTDFAEIYSSMFARTKSDGGYYYILERLIATNFADSKVKVSSGAPRFHYVEIVVLSFNSDLTMEWGQRIPKHQVRTETSLYDLNAVVFSYQPLFVDDRLQVITYLHEKDAVENELPQEPKKAKSRNVQLPVLISLDEQGNMTHQVLYKPKELNNEFLRLPTVHQIDNKTAIFSASKKSATSFSFRYGKLSLP